MKKTNKEECSECKQKVQHKMDCSFRYKARPILMSSEEVQSIDK